MLFAGALAAFVADARSHPFMLNLFDLRVYNGAGTLIRHDPAALYSWHLIPGIKFTYTPFAAGVFAATSLLSWQVLADALLTISIAAVPLTAWLTFGALGWRGHRRAIAALALAGVALWTEPVQDGLHLGQVELALMLLIVADLCQPDRRWHKGAGIGLAAGIKLIPLIFIPYLLLAGKFRQAAVAAGTFAITVGIGFVILPGDSSHYWLTGYFLHPGNTGTVGGPVNQSLLGMLTRLAGTQAAATPVWLACALVIGIAGLAAASLLHRSGQPVAGWVTCGLTGLLVSPISWPHHWVWTVPLLAVLADWGARAAGPARFARWIRFTSWTGAGCWGLAVALAGVFGAWPYRWSGTLAFVPIGLLDFFQHASRQYSLRIGNLLHPVPAAHPVPPGVYHHLVSGYLGRLSVPPSFHLQGSQQISQNLFIGAGLVVFAGLLAVACLGWLRVRRARAPADTPQGGTPRGGTAQSSLTGQAAAAGLADEVQDQEWPHQDSTGRPLSRFWRQTSTRKWPTW